MAQEQRVAGKASFVEAQSAHPHRESSAKGGPMLSATSCLPSNPKLVPRWLWWHSRIAGQTLAMAGALVPLLACAADGDDADTRGRSQLGSGAAGSGGNVPSTAGVAAYPMYKEHLRADYKVVSRILPGLARLRVKQRARRQIPCTHPLMSTPLARSDPGVLAKTDPPQLNG
jgi:hypothetical protein